jgi:hypothetical protein
MEITTTRHVSTTRITDIKIKPSALRA